MISVTNMFPFQAQQETIDLRDGVILWLVAILGSPHPEPGLLTSTPNLTKHLNSKGFLPLFCCFLFEAIFKVF